MNTPLSPAYRETPFWREGIDLPGPFLEGPLPKEADIIVVGGGYTGVSAAWRLAEAGHDVVLLEKDGLGSGASTRNGGLTHTALKRTEAWIAQHYGAAGEPFTRWSLGSYPAFESLIADNGIDCNYERTGYLHCAYGPRQLPALQAEVAEHAGPDGQGAYFVPREGMREEIGSDAYHGGVVVEEAGTIHPGKYFAGLAKLAAGSGVGIHEATPASGIEQLSSGRMRVATPRGAIEARDVLVGTNGYSDAGVPWIRRRVMPIGSYIIVTDVLDPAVAAELSPKGRAFFDSKNFLFYWRLTPDGRMMFGGRSSFAPTTIEKTRDYLYRSMLHVHPQLEGISVAHAWGGKVGFTYDRLPHLTRKDGVTYSGGYCGVGIVNATTFGLRAAEWLGGGEAPPAADRGWPKVPLMVGGNPWFLPVAGAYFRLKDRLSAR